MGTSTSYQMPSGGNWTPLKNDGNRFVTQGPEGAVSPQAMVQGYLAACGGAAGLGGRGRGGGAAGGSRGGSGGGSGGGAAGHAGSTSAARRVGGRVGSFFSRVASGGLDTALREFGLERHVGRSAGDLSAGLLEALAGPGSTIDDHAACLALAELNRELLAEARTPDEVARVLGVTLDRIGVAGVLMRFFGHYIYERFCRDFYERWVKAHGGGATTDALRRVKDYIKSRLDSVTAGRDLTGVNWGGDQGATVISQVLGDTCAVFGVAP